LAAFWYLTRLPKIIKKLETKRQKESGETTEETSGCVSTEQVNKWTNFMIA
jgi:hypothetical protein